MLLKACLLLFMWPNILQRIHSSCRLDLVFSVSVFLEKFILSSYSQFKVYKRSFALTHIFHIRYSTKCTVSTVYCSKANASDVLCIFSTSNAVQIVKCINASLPFTSFYPGSFISLTKYITIALSKLGLTSLFCTEHV